MIVDIAGKSANNYVIFQIKMLWNQLVTVVGQKCISTYWRSEHSHSLVMKIDCWDFFPSFFLSPFFPSSFPFFCSFLLPSCSLCHFNAQAFF